MANKSNRANSKYMQVHYRPKYFKTIKSGAWLTIALIAMCTYALIVR